MEKNKQKERRIIKKEMHDRKLTVLLGRGITGWELSACVEKRKEEKKLAKTVKLTVSINMRGKNRKHTQWSLDINKSL